MAEKSNEPEPLLPQLPPRPVRRDRKKENRGGYDCDFVEKPPEAIQTDCPVCLLILKEPCLISCCGHKFCRECIERVTKDAKPCPLCNEPNFNFMRERKLERFLKGSEVWCSYKKEGCEWSGELGQLQEHLNRDPAFENQLNGCAFVAVECTHKCGEWFQRRHIATHQNEQCKKRPYSCDYCRDYASTFEDVVGVHYPQCDRYPVACPNDCDVYKMERQDLEGHLRDKCPLALVDCPFNCAGCATQLPRKDMPDHMKDTVTHLTLLATVTQRLSIENQKLTKENQQLKERVLEQEDESRKSMEAVQASLQKLMEENQELKQSAAVSSQDLNTKYDSVVAENQQLRDELTEKDKAAKEGIEKVNKKSSGEIQHLRLQLKATIVPLQCQIQKDRKEMYEENHQQFLSTLQRIENKQTRCYILHHNIEHTLQRMDQLLQTTCVSTSDITPTHESELRSTYIPVFPLDFHVKQTDERWYSPAFYAHLRGYQMCVLVDPKGVGDGKGTHVSIFINMMRGPFDDYLKWPFRGSVTIQLVNQAGDHDHVEKNIHFTDRRPDYIAGRVTGSERAEKGWGRPQFLAHADLGYNAVRKTQYLKENHFIVRVVKVVLK